MTLSKIRGQPSRKKTITCSHSIAISGDAWPDDARLSDIEERFTCRVCGKRGADVRPDFNCEQEARERHGLSIKVRRF
jgi:hypothetical protein